MDVRRWASTSTGHSRVVAAGDFVWTVANAPPTEAGFEDQARQSLGVLEAHLLAAGSSRHHILSLQVMLSDMAHRGAFETLWQEWIGPNPEQWPQRACFQAGLAPGLLVELVAVAVPAGGSQRSTA